MNSLPLSWSIKDHQTNTLINNRVKVWNLNWLAYQQLNSVDELKQKINNNLTTANEKFLLRGCNNSQQKKLGDLGFSSFQFGMEAVINTDTNPFSKKSLKLLVKRGLRHGEIKLLPYSNENKEKLRSFQKLSRHGEFIQLKNLFHTNFTSQNRLYVLINKEEKWLGAILLSNNSKKKIHTELILKRKNSPVGVIEALIYKIFIDAKKEGFTELSLGEVPFIFNTKSNIFIKILKTAGSFLQFAYNYKGLYNFKNKFQPQWEPLYICSNNKNKFLDLFLIFYLSNFSKLILQKLFYNLKS